MDMNFNINYSEKEVLNLKDQLDAEALTIRKLMDYKDNIEDPELLHLVDEMIEKHKQHYNRLVNHIK